MKTVFGLVRVLVLTACLPGCGTDAQVTDAQVTEPVAVGPDTFTSHRAPLPAALLLQETLLSQQQTNNARDFRSNSYSSAVTRVLV